MGRDGNFEEVERLQAGIREWLLRTARNGRHELRSIPAPAVLPLLCAAAFGPELADAAHVDSAVAVARTGVLSSVGASVLSDVLAAALDRARSAHAGSELSRADLQREISRSLKEILAGPGERAEAVRSDIAMVLREIDAGGTVFLAAQSAALDASDPVTAALLAGAAWRLSPTAQARYSLLESLAQPVRGVLAAKSGVVTALAYGRAERRWRRVTPAARSGSGISLRIA